MRKKNFTFAAFLIVIFTSLNLLSQNNISDIKSYLDNIINQSMRCSENKSKGVSSWREYFQRDVREMENYDVLYYMIDLDVDFDNELIYGDNIIQVEIVEDNVSNLILDFTNNLTLDDVLMDEISLDFTHEENQIDIDLDGVYSIGDVISLHILYNGHPVPPARYGWGFVFDEHDGENIAFTMVEPFASRDWWPCKDVPIDKAEEIDIWITCPEYYLCASNGVLEEEINNGDGTKTFKWHESYPISTYLVSISITNYDLYSIPYSYNGSEMNIDNYLFPEQYDDGVSLFSQTPPMLDFLSTVYCPYPFLDEKYGHAVYPGNGAMEHQTCTSFGSNYVNEYGSYIVLHELAHQWVGDLITCEDWSHIWLNEGFAVYSECLWTENNYGLEWYLYHLEQLDLGNDIDDKLHRDESGDGNYILDIVVYFKGAWTLHMLRGVIGDAMMDQVLQEYSLTPEFRYGTATTEDFSNVVAQVTGTDYSWFFEQWFYHVGRPLYKYATYTSELEDAVKIAILSEGSQGELFDMFIPFEINGAPQTLWAEGGFSHTTFPLIGNLSSLEFDPDNWVLDYGYEEKVPLLYGEPAPREGVVHLTWEDFFDPEIEGYNIYRKIAGEEYLLLNTEPVNATGFTDDNVEMEQLYFYKIAVVSESDYLSKFSNEISAIPVDFTFDQGILIVDETYDYPEISPFPTDEEVDLFYSELLNENSFDFAGWDLSADGEIPLTEMAQYSSIIWHTDDLINHPFENSILNLKNYLNAGGNLFISSWKNLTNVPEDFLEDFLFIESPEYNINIDFSGAFGEQGFSDITVDPAKVLPNWNNELQYTNKFINMETTDVIYRYDSLTDDPEWEDEICGIKYDGTYKFIVLGFPLYFMDQNEASNLMNNALVFFDEEISIADNFEIEQQTYLTNYPNPFSSVTTISFNLTAEIAENAEISIYNLKGQKVKTLECVNYIDAKATESLSHIVWNGKDDKGNEVASGLYFYKLES